jgi:hypothetical protein
MALFLAARAWANDLYPDMQPTELVICFHTERSVRLLMPARAFDNGDQDGNECAPLTEPKKRCCGSLDLAWINPRKRREICFDPSLIYVPEPKTMTGDDLDKAQTRKVADALFPSVNYLVRLKQRMQAKDFEPGDPLLVLTEQAYEAVQRLYLDLLNRSASGNMRPRPIDPPRGTRP